ncbi:MAG: aldehyde dehydrogenase family protein [Victivallaceae bacterium]|nr:aldehyde dehydrogenase family protein [Victivallaceae bacterium]
MKMLISGKWVDKEEVIPVKNPYDDSFIDSVPRADEKDVENALRSASRGAEIMRRLPALRRAKILEKTAELLEKDGEKFAGKISEEVGKTLKEAGAEVNRAIQVFRISSEEAKRISGETVPFDAAPGAANKQGFYLRVPVGIILAITPFNFPLNLAAHKIAPALAAGNSVILKPSSLTPLADLMLAETMLNAGLPEEALNVITGPGASVGLSLAEDPRIRMITFTGSAEAGKAITRRAGLKKIAMELGSNSAVILMDDADLKSALPRLLTGGYGVAGQVCISVQRLIVHRKILDSFLAKFTPLVRKLQIGNQLAETTDMGPLISEQAAVRAETWIREAEALGAKCEIEVKRTGSLLSPTVITGVTPEMKVFSEEAFAPFVTVTDFEDLPAAINLVNNSKYGLQAGIYTGSISTAFKAIGELEVGGVIINDIPAFRVDLMPYGGFKESGIGREGVKYTVQEMTEIKLACFNL